MLFVFIILAVIATLILAEVVAFLLYRIKAPLGRRRTLEFLLYRRNGGYTADTQVSSQDAPSRYSEHPFTGWSLSPSFVNIHGSRVHNRQGFRTDGEFEEQEQNVLKVYCAGGSSTYCTDIERNEDTWPALLGDYLTDALGQKVQVVNGGVGGFNTYQSYIRLSAYIDILKPDLVVVYHAKNDLTPFYNGGDGSEGSFPDYSNLMRSLSFRGMADAISPLAKWSFVAKLWAIFKMPGKQLSLGYVYNHSGQADVPVLLAAKTDYSIIETMQRNMVGLCQGRGIDIVYLTQRVDDPIFNRYIQSINDRIRQLENNNQGTYVFDLDRAFPYDPSLMVDKMHFSTEGCRQVASLLGQYISDSKLLPSTKVLQRSAID